MRDRYLVNRRKTGKCAPTFPSEEVQRQKWFLWTLWVQLGVYLVRRIHEQVLYEDRFGGCDLVVFRVEGHRALGAAVGVGERGVGAPVRAARIGVSAVSVTM